MKNQDENKKIILGNNIDADYILEVKDDSMAGDGINKGDLAFIREMPFVGHGYIAAVVLDGEVMFRRVFIEDDGYLLKASNSEYSPRLIRDDVVLGEVVGIFKKAKHEQQQQEPISLAEESFKTAAKDPEPEVTAMTAFLLWARMVQNGHLPNPGRHNEFLLKRNPELKDSRLAAEFSAFVGGMDFALEKHIEPDVGSEQA